MQVSRAGWHKPESVGANACTFLDNNVTAPEDSTE